MEWGWGLGAFVAVAPAVGMGLIQFPQKSHKFLTQGLEPIKPEPYERLSSLWYRQKRIDFSLRSTYMIKLTFPDGQSRDFETGINGYEVAKSLSVSLAKQAALLRLNGQLYDLHLPIETDAQIEILKRDHKDVLDTIRHDAAHIMAQAVQELFPGTQVTIGPAIEDGFYYDFAREQPFSLNDLETIEARMKAIIDRDEPIRREEWDRQKAIAHFETIGESYKAEIIRDLPETAPISIYRHGDHWMDLCLGPHMPSSKFVGKAFKLTKLAGAYWRGDHKNAQLQRIYGTAWTTELELQEHLTRIEEAEKRDHRKLGRAMNLFISKKKAVGWSFGMIRGGHYGAHSNPICAVAWKKRAILR